MSESLDQLPTTEPALSSHRSGLRKGTQGSRPSFLHLAPKTGMVLASEPK